MSSTCIRRSVNLDPAVLVRCTLMLVLPLHSQYFILHYFLWGHWPPCLMFAVWQWEQLQADQTLLLLILCHWFLRGFHFCGESFCRWCRRRVGGAAAGGLFAGLADGMVKKAVASRLTATLNTESQISGDAGLLNTIYIHAEREALCGS